MNNPAVSSEDDTWRVVAGEPVDLNTASLDARTLLLTEAAHDAGALIAGGRLSEEHATAYLLRYAEQLHLHGPQQSADAKDVDAGAIVAACLAAASKPWASLPVPDLGDPSTWGELHGALLRVSGQASPAPVREIRPGVRASESFVSVTMAQATLVWLARTAPAAQPWMSLVLVLGELEERRAENEKANSTIRQLRARIAELNDE